MVVNGVDESRRSNKVRIAKCILDSGEISKAEIASKLDLSMPTVFKNIKELIQLGIVTEGNEYQSTGGRKAKGLSIADHIMYAAGIDITRNHISYVFIDLKGNLLCQKRIRSSYENTLDYYEALYEEFICFLKESGIERNKILGVGISVPGIIDAQNQMIITSHVLKVNNVSLKNLSQLFEFDVYYENDANSAAIAEFADRNRDAVYVSLSDTVGGCVYINQGVYTGEHYRSAEFGHMNLVRNGAKCYCGKKGCADVYCSARVLSCHGNGSLEGFFDLLQAGDESAKKVWEKYLEDLAVLVTDLRMVFDCDIILGGYVGGYLKKYIMDLNKKVVKLDPFDNDTTYLQTCRYEREASAVGIAMRFIEKYFDMLL